MSGVDGSALIGRERESALLRQFLLEGRAAAASVLVVGPAGIGKTSLWEAAVDEARSAGGRVLVARPSRDESRLGFASLSDLLEDLDPERFDRLPTPRRDGLRAALLLSDSQPAADERAVSAAVLAVLGGLASERRLVVAIDDVQWIDSASRSALAFAFRRLRDVDLRVLLTERATADEHELDALERALSPDRLEVGPLSFGAVGRLWHQSLGLTLSRPLARRLYEMSAGNPMFALELARAIAARGGDVGPDRPMPLPDRLEALLGDRVGALTPEVREALLAATLSGDAKLSELDRVVGEDVLGDAARAGVVVIDGPRVRPAHPLLGEVVAAQARPSERRALHKRLAAIVDDEERRALHLSETTVGTDVALASTVAAAAAHADARAALATAADLGERALRLTPESDPAWTDRLLLAGEYNRRAGELSRAAELLRPAIDKLPAGPLRARGLYVLSWSAPLTAREVMAYGAQALENAAERTTLRAHILGTLSVELAVGSVERLADAERFAVEGLEIAREVGPAAQISESLAALMWVRSLRGRPIDDLVIEHGQLQGSDASSYTGPERILAVLGMWRGEIAPARHRLRHLLELADARGEGEAHFAVRLNVCELELRAARWEIVEELLEEWERERGEAVGHRGNLLRCRALLAVGRGDAPAGAQLAQAGIDAVEAPTWTRLEVLRARGLAELLDGDPDAASTSLGEVWAHTEDHGVENPGTFPVGPDLAQALTDSGRTDEAQAVAKRLADLGERQDHPWAKAAGASAWGHVSLATGDAAAAAAAFSDAAGRFEALELPLYRARAQTGLGAAQRRLRQRGDARASLEAAVSLLDRIGSPGWASAAHLELSRIGGRRKTSGALTPSEQRVAELVAQGFPNKQVAAQLVVSVRAVEAHLTRIYAKLGVRSRTELVRALIEQVTSKV